MESSSPEELPIRKPGCYETLYWAPLSMTEQPITPRVVVQEGSVLFCSQILWVRSLRRCRGMAHCTCLWPQLERLDWLAWGGGVGGPHSYVGTWFGLGEGWS